MLSCSTVQAGSSTGWRVSHDQRALPVGVAGLDDLLVAGQRGRIAAGPDQPVVAGDQRVDVARDLHP